MAVQLPTPGEEPWGEELNAAITGIDNDLQASKASFDSRLDTVEAGGGGGGGAPSQYVPVFIFNGESNSGGLGENAKAIAAEIAPRAAVQIFDNTGLTAFQTLDIGVNNLVGHDEFAPQEQANRHGWELGLANSVEAGEWLNSTVYLIKTGQGGSTIAEWNEAGPYWQAFLARTRPALALLRSQGKIPVIYVWWTLGINDKGAGTSVATWKAGVQAFFVRLRDELGFVPIFAPTFMVYAGMPDWNTALGEIAAADNMFQVIDSTGAGVISQPDFGSDVHWNYNGMKTLASRLGSASRNFGQHEGYDHRRIDTLATSGIVEPPPAVDVSLVCAPTLLSFTEGSAGGVVAVSLDKAPPTNVNVAASVAGGNAAVAPTTLTFTPSNWSTGQSVTVTSPNDGAASGNRTATLTLSSSGVMGPASIAVTITDAGVGATAPVNTVLPAISGTTTVGSTLSCSQGTWTQSPTSYAYQWKRGGTAISGATASTYAVVAGDQGTTLTCTVTATNATGSTPATSAGTAIPAPPAPANTVLPAITGTAAVDSTLTCSQGTWSGSPTSYAYQWKRDLVVIAGATASTYLVVTADKSMSLTCTVTATNANGSTSATSTGLLIPGDPWAALPPVDWASLQNTTTPTQGTLLWNTTIPGGGMVTAPIDLTQAFDIELEYASAQDAAIVTVDEDNAAYYDWSSQLFLFCAYPYQGAMYVGTTMGNPAPIAGVTMTYPCHFKISKSGNDVVFRYGAGANPYGAVIHTLSGVLSGKTTAYLKGMYLGPGTTLKVNKA